MATKRSRAARRGATTADSSTPDLAPTEDIEPTPDLPPTPELAQPVRSRAALSLVAAEPAPPRFSGASGDDVLALARRHVGERYLLGARAPLGNPSWSGPWDCAELVSWCVFQASRIIYGAEPRNDPMLADAFTGFWADQARAGHADIDWRDAVGIPGAAILRKAAGGTIGHIVISDGNGGTVEAHSRNTGVIEGTVAARRWDFGVLVPGIRYLRSDSPPALLPAPDTLRLTQPLTRGERVRRIQRRLTALQFLPGTPDGIYGPQTAHAVRQFQSSRGLVVDGEVGATTAAALDAAQ